MNHLFHARLPALCGPLLSYGLGSPGSPEDFRDRLIIWRFGTRSARGNILWMVSFLATLWCVFGVKTNNKSSELKWPPRLHPVCYITIISKQALSWALTLFHAFSANTLKSWLVSNFRFSFVSYANMVSASYRLL